MEQHVPKFRVVPTYPTAEATAPDLRTTVGQAVITASRHGVRGLAATALVAMASLPVFVLLRVVQAVLALTTFGCVRMTVDVQPLPPKLSVVPAVKS